jgi:ferritin-like protein
MLDAADEIDALKSRIEVLEKIKANLIGDDENLPRYTTKRFNQEVENKTKQMQARIQTLEWALRRTASSFDEICASSEVRNQTISLILSALEARS